MKKLIITVTIFMFCWNSFAQLKSTIQSQSVSDSGISNIAFHQILDFHINNAIKRLNQNSEFTIDLFSIKIMLSDSLTLLSYEESIGTPKQLSLSLKSAFSKAIDTGNKLNVIASGFKNKNIVVPIYIYNNPKNEKFLNVEASLNEIENIFIFKSSLSSVVSKYKYPCECVTLAPVVVSIPNLDNRSNKYKRRWKPTNK